METKVARGGRRHSRQKLPESSSRGTDLQNVNERKSSSKKRNNKSCSDFRPWSELLEELLDLISRKLSIVDFFAFGGVCTAWRSFYLLNRQYFMASQPPQVAIISIYAKRTCYFFDPSKILTYRTMLPNFAGRHRVGFASGYLVILDRNSDLWLINPFTRHELRFARLIKHNVVEFIIDHVFVASIRNSTHYVVLTLTYMDETVQVYQSKHSRWSVYQYKAKLWAISDITIFRGKIYFVTTLGQIGILDLRSPDLDLLKFKNSPSFGASYYKLTASKDQLLILDFIPPRTLQVLSCTRLQVYAIDVEKMEYVKVVNLGNQALFVDDARCCVVNNPIIWGGLNNCVYHLEPRAHICCVYSMDGEIMHTITIDPPGASTLISKCWYFPHHCYTIDDLEDD